MFKFSRIGIHIEFLTTLAAAIIVTCFFRNSH